MSTRNAPRGDTPPCRGGRADDATRGAVPPRSRLYSLAPLGLATPLVESLTSYLHRLAWSYRVSVRALVAQEVLPHLRDPSYVRASPAQLSGFARCRASSLNGTGATAADWARTLEQLTARTDLRHLTVRPWAEGVPAWGLLRPVPAWCPACYHDWQGRGQPAYQPLLWMLQEVTICPTHQTRLRAACPACGRHQSPLAARTPPGCCTQCASVLGAPLASVERETDDAVLAWQAWVLGTIEDLRRASVEGRSLPWDYLPDGIAACIAERGSARHLGRRVHASKQLFLSWRHGTRRPSFGYLLRACYVLNLSPLQLMSRGGQEVPVLRAAASSRQVPLPQRRGPPPADLARIEAFLHAVLAGHERPHAVSQAARHLRVGEKFLVRRYPRECAQITAQYQAYRTARAQQKVAHECEEVRQATLAVHAAGAFPSTTRVAARLSDPHILRRPAAKEVWRALRCDLGYVS
jgi:hypothetical protein